METWEELKWKWNDLEEWRINFLFCVLFFIILFQFYLGYKLFFIFFYNSSVKMNWHRVDSSKPLVYVFYNVAADAVFPFTLFMVAE